MIKNSQKTAVIYARVSTVGQAEKELPIESQLQQCKNKAKELGCQVVRVFIDEGVSAKSDDRPEFQNLITLCETGDIDYLVTWSSSRFSRNKLDAGLYKRRLHNCGTKLTYVCMDLDTSTDMGWLTDSMLEIFDEHFSRQVRNDTMRSMLKNAQEGFYNGGPPPYGFKSIISLRNPKKKELAPIQTEVAVVEMIFKKKRDEGVGIRLMAIWLNERGYTNRGRPWTRSAIWHLLKSRAVIGQSVFNKKDRVTRKLKPENDWVIVDAHEPIIDRKIWDEVQRLIKSDSDNRETGGTSRSQHYFTGLSYCGECGSRMRAESAKGRSRTYYYYNCNAAWETKAHKNRRIPAVDLDEWLIKLICNRVIGIDAIRVALDRLSDERSKWKESHRLKKAKLVKDIRPYKPQIQSYSACSRVMVTYLP